MKEVIQYARESKYTKFAEKVKQILHQKAVKAIDDYKKVALK